MAQPLTVYAVNVSTNIAICTILGPIGLTGIQTPPGVQRAGGVIQSASVFGVGGSTGVGTNLAFQELGADSTTGNLIWRTLATPAAVVIANSTAFGSTQIAGPLLGLQILVSGAVGNGVAYVRITAICQEHF